MCSELCELGCGTRAEALTWFGSFLLRCCLGFGKRDCLDAWTVIFEFVLVLQTGGKFGSDCAPDTGR